MNTLFELKLPQHRNRRPDVLFVPYSVWPMGKRLPRSNAWAVTLTICVEVVSPTDSAEEVMTKVAEYLEAGVAEVWVIYPIGGIAMTFNSVGQTRMVRHGERLTGGSALPGFKLELNRLLPEAE